MIDTIPDLLDVDTSSLPAGTQASVAGYHEKGDGGGGIFYWDPNEDKANHNGGTIIDPTQTFPDDWSNTTQQETWFTPAGSGSGCWKRIYEDRISIEWFGAKGDGVTDDAKAVQKAVDQVSLNGGTVVFGVGTYYITSPISVTSSGVCLVGRGYSTLIKGSGAGNQHIIEVHGVDANNRISNIEIAYLRINPQSSVGGGTAIRCFYIENSLFHHLWIEDSDGGVILGIEEGGAVNCVVHSCVTQNIKFYGFGFYGSSDDFTTDCLIANCIDLDSLEDSFRFGNMRRCQLVNCKSCNPARYGFFVQGEWYDLLLSNVTVYNSGSHAIVVGAGSEAERRGLISNFVVYGGGAKGLFTGYGNAIQRTKIMNGVIFGCVEDGMYIRCNRVEFDNITVVNCGSDTTHWGVNLTSDSNYNILTGIRTENNYNDQDFVDNGNGNILRHFKGSRKTENWGIATITNGTNNVAVNHGLLTAPTHISLLGTHNEVSALYVTDVSATQFVIRIRDGANVTADRTVYWHAIVR